MLDRIRMLAVLALMLPLWSCAGSGASREGWKESASPAASQASGAPQWSFNGTIIEACSCPMFCQCYFNAKPAEHPGCCPEDGDPKSPPRYCRFNNAFRVNHGRYGDTKLDGARFWIAGDLGGDFSDGEMDWAVVHFDPAVAPAQREGILAALGGIYAVRWKEFRVGPDLAIEWQADKDRAVAKLDGGKAAEVVLKRNQGMTDEPIVMHNLRYWGAPRNDGFIMMQNEVEAYRLGDAPYEHRGTNGFMITVDASSADAKPASSGY